MIQTQLMQKIAHLIDQDHDWFIEHLSPRYGTMAIRHSSGMSYSIKLNDTFDEESPVQSIEFQTSISEAKAKGWKPTKSHYGNNHGYVCWEAPQRRCMFSHFRNRITHDNRPTGLPL